MSLREGNTEEENNGYVVFIWTIDGTAGKKGCGEGEGEGALLRQYW